jgi:hypothetical protein
MEKEIVTGWHIVMDKFIILPCMLTLLWACTPGTVETSSSKDSVADAVQEQVASAPFPDLDLDNLTVYTGADTATIFSERSYYGSSDSLEAIDLQKDTRVMRTPEGLRFRLKNGEHKLLKENKDTESDDFASYSFLEPMDNIGQWLLMGGYYEAFDYVLIDQQDGSETHLWGRPILSPDGQYFLTGMVDLDAAFVPTGFQMWSITNNKPVLRWEKELTDWGSDNFIWTNDNHIIAEQTYRDEASGGLKTRFITMKILQ